MTLPEGRGPGMTGAEPCSFAAEGPLAVLTLAGGNGNRLDFQMLSAIDSALDVALGDPACRAILLRSSDTAFCLGMNLDVLAASLTAEAGADREAAATAGNTSAGSRADAVALYGKVLEKISFGPKPVLALVEGPVKAGGVGLVAACDVVVLESEAASFELSEVLFGLLPANVLPFLMKTRISVSAARYLVLTARCIDAAEALRLGLADLAFPGAELEKGLRDIVRTLVRAEPGALAAGKRFIRDNMESNFETFREKARRELLDLMKKPPVLQGLEAFKQGETPPWFARFKPAGQLTGASSLGDAKV